MSQTTVLAADTSAADSSVITIAAGETATFALFPGAGESLPNAEGINVYLDTPGEDVLIASLSPQAASVAITGPAEVIFKRAASDFARGVVQYG